MAAGDNKVVTGDAVNTAINAINLNTAGNSGTGSVNLATQSLNITGTNGLQTEAKANGIEVKLMLLRKIKLIMLQIKASEAAHENGLLSAFARSHGRR